MSSDKSSSIRRNLERVASSATFRATSRRIKRMRSSFVDGAESAFRLRFVGRLPFCDANDSWRASCHSFLLPNLTEPNRQISPHNQPWIAIGFTLVQLDGVLAYSAGSR